MKLYPPHNFGGMSIDNRPVMLEGDGSVTCDTRDVDHLVAHGFTSIPAGERVQQQVPQQMTKEQGMQAAIDRLPEFYTDVEYVVNGMLNFYGEAFTAEAEKAVRAKFPPKSPQQPPAPAATDAKGKGDKK